MQDNPNVKPDYLWPDPYHSSTGVLLSLYEPFIRTFYKDPLR